MFVYKRVKGNEMGTDNKLVHHQCGGTLFRCLPGLPKIGTGCQYEPTIIYNYQNNVDGIWVISTWKQQ